MNVKENIETGHAKERKSSHYSNKEYVIFLVLPIICTILFPLGGIFYIYGRLSWHIGLVLFVLYPAAGFIIYCFFASIVRLIGGWRKSTWKRKLLIAAEVGIPIVFIVLFIIPFFIPIESELRPPGWAFTYGFRDRIRSKADIPTIRDWLKTLSEEDYNDHDVRLFPDEWPKSLEALNPGKVYLSTDKNGNPQVRIIWGGAIFHWCVVIGLEDMEIAPSDLRHWAESWLLVEPGVYVWDW